MIISSTRRSLWARSRGSRIRLRSLSASLMSRKTDVSVAIVIEVSTISGGGVLNIEDPVGVGLEAICLSPEETRAKLKASLTPLGGRLAPVDD